MPTDAINAKKAPMITSIPAVIDHRFAPVALPEAAFPAGAVETWLSSSRAASFPRFAFADLDDDVFAGHAALKHKSCERHGCQKPYKPKSNRNINIEIVTGFQTNDGNKANRNANQHIKRDYPVGQCRSDNHS